MCNHRKLDRFFFVILGLKKIKMNERTNERMQVWYRLTVIAQWTTKEKSNARDNVKDMHIYRFLLSASAYYYKQQLLM